MPRRKNQKISENWDFGKECQITKRKSGKQENQIAGM